MWIVFDTEAEAVAAEALISARGRAMYQARGYGLDAGGAVIIPEGGVIARWSEIVATADGRWAILSPEGHQPHGRTGVLAPAEVAALLAGIGGETVAAIQWPGGPGA